jgi:hypothetical protein
MDTFMSEAIVLEAVLISVLLALWVTWLLMRGLFLLMPATNHAAAPRPIRPIRLVANRPQANRRRDAA